MAKILLGVTGSVAAIKTPDLVEALLQQGHHVKVIATAHSLYFFDRSSLPENCLYTDKDEWPRQNTGKTWQRCDEVLHIELRRWAELMVIAPLDANTLAKLANGICDNCLTCVWRAWDLGRPVLLAPAMNTLMWEHPHTVRHLVHLAQLFGITIEPSLEADQLADLLGKQTVSPLRLVGPISKKLACGDTGQGAMAELPDILNSIQGILTATS